MLLSIKEGKGEGYYTRKHFKGKKKFYAYYQDFEIKKLLEKAGFQVNIIEKEYKDQTWLNIIAKRKN